MHPTVKCSPSGLGEVQKPWSAVNQSVEFLFVVLEVTPFEDELVNGVNLEADRWGNYMPPNTYKGYGTEEVGRVFKYDNGTVSLAEDYTWYRPEAHQPGSIGKSNLACIDPKDNLFPAFEPCRPHTARTIFNCGPFMGIVIKMKDASVDPVYEDNNGYYTDEEYESDDDVSIENAVYGDLESWSKPSDVGKGGEGFWDVSSRLRSAATEEIEWPSLTYDLMDWGAERDSESWLAMKFEHDNGVSRISLGDEGRRYAAGNQPKWIPSIVPTLYTNPDTQSDSRGLGGDMATLIGLLALTQERDHCDEAFYRPLNPDTELGIFSPYEYHQARVAWKRHRWNGTRHNNACGCS